jgi:tetratricopeptide (TPR) repeat protein
MVQMNRKNAGLKSDRSNTKRRAPLLAAVLAVPFLAVLPARIAHAQFPVNNNNGHANDANNQVGSGGYNAPSRPNTGVTANDIVYGNVTGLRGFSARLQETDPTAFRATTFTFSADRFIGQSNPSAVRGTPSANVSYYTPTAYYSDARGVAAPSGTVSVVGGGGYVPSNSIQAGQYSNQLTDQAANGAYRTGAGNGSDTTFNPTDGLNGAYVPFGTDLRLGPTDLGNQQSFLVVSPLSGVQQGQLDNGPDNYYLSRTQMRVQGGDRFQRIDDRTLQQMRREAQLGTDQQADANGQNANGQNATELNNSMLPPLEAPSNKPLDASVGSALNTAQPMRSAVGTQEGMYRTLSTAAQQTPVLSELDQRLAQYKQRAPVAEEQEAKFQSDLKAATASTSKVPGAPSPLTPGGLGRPAQRGIGTATGGGSVGLTPAAPKPDLGALAGGTRTEPVHISSLAEGVRAKGLAGLLKAAEDLMKQGRYSSAIDQYSLAQQVAPNNPLIPLGQANAELGAASYRDAEQHLRQVFGGDEALLHAQFDLNSLMKPERVRTLIDDLKDLAAKDPKAEMPVFLLAYLNYNTGHEAEAMKYLGDVDKREGRADPIVARMLRHWYVPASTGTKPAMPELNK